MLQALFSCSHTLMLQTSIAIYATREQFHTKALLKGARSGVGTMYHSVTCATKDWVRTKPPRALMHLKWKVLHITFQDSAPAYTDDMHVEWVACSAVQWGTGTTWLGAESAITQDTVPDLPPGAFLRLCCCTARLNCEVLVDAAICKFASRCTAWVVPEQHLSSATWMGWWVACAWHGPLPVCFCVLLTAMSWPLNFLSDDHVIQYATTLHVHAR